MIEVHCRLKARPGEDAALGTALLHLADRIGGVADCGGVAVMQSADDPAQFAFVGKWPSTDAQEEAGPALGAETFAPIVALAAAKPDRLIFVPFGRDRAGSGIEGDR